MFRNAVLALFWLLTLAGGALAQGTYPTPTFKDVITSADPRFYGAKCDGTTDDSAAMTAWAAAVKPYSTAFVPGVCVFKTPLAFPLVDNVSLVGTGRPSQLLYTGVATTGDIVTIGNPAGGCTSGWSIRDLQVMSSTVMTGGTGLKLNALCLADIRGLDVGGGVNFGNTNWWDAVWFKGGNTVHVDRYVFQGRNTAEIITGMGTSFAQSFADMFQTHGAISHSGVGLNVAGNVGMVFVDQTDILLNGENVRVSQDRIANYNYQVNFGSGVFIDATDSTTYPSGSQAGIHIADAGSAVFSQLVLDGTWVSSARAQCILIDNASAYYVKWTGGVSHDCNRNNTGNAWVDNQSVNGRVEMNGMRFYTPGVSTLPYVYQVAGSIYPSAMTLNDVRFAGNATTTPPFTSISGPWTGSYITDNGTITVSSPTSYTVQAPLTVNSISSDGSVPFNLTASGAKAMVLNANGGGQLVFAGTGGLYPGTNNTTPLGTATNLFSSVRATAYFAGANIAGVSCATGTVTAATMVVTNGIVTHC